MYLSGGCTIFNRRLVQGVLIKACFCFGLLEAAPLSASELPAIEFSVKPRICVLTGDEEACYDELVVRWRSGQAMSLCLYRSDFEKPLQCWAGQDHGEHRFVLSTSENITFHLRENEQGLEVSQAFEVIHDQKQYRRARRNPWSFF